MEYFIQYASLPLRIILGIIFITHGFPKIKNMKNTKKMVKSLGFFLPSFFAFILAVTEFFGGIAILIGAFTRIPAVLLIFSMSIAVYARKFNWNQNFKEGYEFDILVIASLITLILLGSGNFSIDNLFRLMI